MLPERIELPDAVLRPFRTSDADALARAVGEAWSTSGRGCRGRTTARPSRTSNGGGSSRSCSSGTGVTSTSTACSTRKKARARLVRVDGARPQQPGDRLLGARGRTGRGPRPCRGRAHGCRAHRARRTAGPHLHGRGERAGAAIPNGSVSSYCGSRPRTASRPARPAASRCGGARRRSAPTTTRLHPLHRARAQYARMRAGSSARNCTIAAIRNPIAMSSTENANTR